MTQRRASAGDGMELVLWRLAQVEQLLAQIHDEVRATNGRLRELERWRARLEGMRAAWHWLSPAASGVVSAVLTAGAMRVIGL